jgi:hypothetical protein
MGLLFLWLQAVNCAAFEIPKGLSADDRKEVISIIGLNSANKALSNPYPLGGYSGFEVGYSLEIVNVRDLRRLGCTVGSAGCANTQESDDTEWRYSRLTFGKGIYNNIDIFFSFVPPTGDVRVSDYGGQIRWSFYQAEYLPINVSVTGHFNQLNFGDIFADRNFGVDMIAGVNVNNFAIYFGGGWISARGTFLAGNCANCTVSPTDPAVNSDSNTVTTTLDETHTVVGFSLHFDNLFTAAQVDRYRDAVYSLKVGMRF